MKDPRTTAHKTVGWAALAYGAFTALSIIGPLLLQRLWAKHSHHRGW